MTALPVSLNRKPLKPNRISHGFQGLELEAKDAAEQVADCVTDPHSYATVPKLQEQFLWLRGKFGS